MDIPDFSGTVLGGTPDTSPDLNQSVSELPSYYRGLDAHNDGNGNFAFTDPTTWNDGLSNVGKFIVGAAISGLDGTYNSFATGANWFGADVEKRDTYEDLSNLDSNLGDYYTAHKSGIDAVGFIASSLVPGFAGVKLLNAGQKVLRLAVESGEIGGTLGRAIGLLTPEVKMYRAASAAQIEQAQAAFSLINTNTVKALAAGVIQNTLEGAAFETAAIATNFKSPTLDQADGWAIAKDIALGGITAGAIGGTIEAAKTFGFLRAAIKPTDLAEKPVTYRTQLNSGSSSADRIITAAHDIENTPSEESLTGKNATKLIRLRGNKINSLNLEMRDNIHYMLVGDDTRFGNQLADTIHSLPADQITANFQYAQQIGKLSDSLSAESSLAKAAKKASEYPPGAATPNYKIGFLKLLGEDRGGISFTGEPDVKNLADIHDSPGKIKEAIDGYGFKDSAIWSPQGKDHLEAEGRYWWADNKAKITDGMKVGEHDIPLLERIYQEWAAANKGTNGLDVESLFKKISVVPEDGSANYDITNIDDFFRHLRRSKQELANNLLAGKSAGSGDSIEAISKITNVKKSYLQGEQSYLEGNDLFAHQFYQKEYTQSLVDKGLWKPEKGLIDTTMLPSWAKISYDVAPILGNDGKVLSGMAWMMAKQKLLQDGVNNVASKYFGKNFQNFIPLDSSDVIFANRIGAGPGLISSANANYGTTAAKVQSIGQATSVARKAVKDITQDTLNPIAYRLMQNPEAAIEWASLHQKVSATAEHYVLSDDGTSLIIRSLKRYQDNIAKGKTGLTAPTIQQGAEKEIPLVNQEVQDAVAAHIKLNGDRIQSTRELRAAQGLEDQKDPNTFYPVRPNIRDYNHFAFVVDPTVTSGSAGHITMIHATDGSTLEQLIDRVPNNYKVITKQQSEEFHRAIQDYDYDRTLHENYINPDLRRAGINSQFFLQSDPTKIVQDWISDHMRRDDVLVREMVNGIYEPQFQELRRLGEQYTGISTSKYQGTYRYAESDVKNPYLNYVKTALDINQLSEYPLLQGFNTIVDRTVSNAYQTITNIWRSVKSPEDLEKVNNALQTYGIKTAYQDAATQILANHPAAGGILSKFVRGANSILGSLIIKLDPLYTVNHIMGASVLLGSEAQSIFRNILAGNSDAVGALAQLKDILVPGTTDSITAPSKIIAQAYKNLSQGSVAYKEFYTRNGWYGDSIDNFRSLLDDFTLEGNESERTLQTRLNSAFQKAKDLAEEGANYTGTKWAIQSQRFIAANVMDQITDIAVKAGLMGEKEKISYINSFVNRTQGNYLASQRPIIFQGPIGQAVGLFQTYQFNIMQQLFRHVAEGTTKDAAMLLGLQSTLYGLNGLPAFNFINTHIIGTASGNPNHTDLYSSTYGIFGKTVGDWLLYGAPSNMLNTNLFSRGDLNPRQVTVIPTNPADIPAIGGFINFFGNLKSMSQKIASGGDVWETFLQGIEHNGLFRPLAGLAQEMQAFGPGGYSFSTSSKGNILGTNDLLSLASLSRLAGGRPFNEAVTNDAMYRMSAYQAADTVRKEKLEEAIKTSVVAGRTPSNEAINEFAAGYAALGGDTKRFNNYMLNQITKANTPQAEIMMQKLKSSYNQNMQQIMGGRDPFANTGY